MRTRSRKGQMKVVEVIIAAILIFASLLFSLSFIPPSSQPYKINRLQRLGYEVLYSLDTSGDLNKMVFGEQWWSLQSSIDVLLPKHIFFNLTIYDSNGYAQNTMNITNGDIVLFEDARDEVVIRYVLPGYNKSLNVRILEMGLVEG